MKKLFLTLFIVACACSVTYAQGTSAQKSKRRVVNTGSPNGLFSSAVITGDLVFTSGHIGTDPKTGQMADNFAGQFEQVFTNLTATLDAAGSSTDQILKVTVFLADMNDYNTLNELYRKKFKADPPARTTIQVARLPRDAKVEIEAVAVLK